MYGRLRTYRRRRAGTLFRKVRTGRRFSGKRRKSSYGRRRFSVKRFRGRRNFLGRRRSIRRYGRKARKFPNPVVRINDISPIQTSLSVDRGYVDCLKDEISTMVFGVGSSSDFTTHVWNNVTQPTTDPQASMVDLTEVRQLVRLYNPSNARLKITLFNVLLRRDSSAGGAGSTVETDYRDAISEAVPSAQASNFDYTSYMASPYLAPDFLSLYRLSRKKVFNINPGQVKNISIGWKGFYKLRKEVSDSHNLKNFCKNQLLLIQPQVGTAENAVGFDGTFSTGHAYLIFESWHRFKYRYRPVNKQNLWIPSGTLPSSTTVLLTQNRPVTTQAYVPVPESYNDIRLETHNT